MPAMSPAQTISRSWGRHRRAQRAYVIGRLRRNYSLDKDKLGDPDAAPAASIRPPIGRTTRASAYLADWSAPEDMMGSEMPSRWRTGAHIGSSRRRRSLMPNVEASMAAWCKKLLESYGEGGVAVVKLEIGGSEAIPASARRGLWVAAHRSKGVAALHSRLKGPDEIAARRLQGRHATARCSVGGSFEGEYIDADKQAPRHDNIKVSGAGTLGHPPHPPPPLGNWTARVEIEMMEKTALSSSIKEMVRSAACGRRRGRALCQRSKNLIGRSFVALRKEFEQADQRRGGIRDGSMAWAVWECKRAASATGVGGRRA